MRNLKKLTIIGLLILFSVNTNAQIWPFAPINRLGNTVYYPIDSLQIDNLTCTNRVFDKKLTDRYFDLILNQDSVGMSINDSIVYFKQKPRNEPKSYKQILFYKRRILVNSNTKIKYLKLTSINDNEIIALATLKQNSIESKSKRKEVISINKNNIKGVFLGSGQTYRAILTGIEISAIVLLAILKGIN